MHHVLLIDDDTELAAPLATYLRRFDFTLEHAAHPRDGLARLAASPPDAVILDVMLPELDGFEVCRRIRRDPRLRGLPVLMLSARGDVTDRVVGLELGADDYLPKPFEPRELAARLQTILRRANSAAAAAPDASTAPGTSPDELRFDGLRIDRAAREVWLRDATGQDRSVALTSTEYELLLMLALRPGRVYSRDEILAQLRGSDADIYTRAVDILVSRLRRKLEPLVVIKTLRHAGYTFARAAAS